MHAETLVQWSSTFPASWSLIPKTVEPFGSYLSFCEATTPALLNMHNLLSMTLPKSRTRVPVEICERPQDPAQVPCPVGDGLNHGITMISKRKHVLCGPDETKITRILCADANRGIIAAAALLPHRFDTSATANYRILEKISASFWANKSLGPVPRRSRAS